MPRPLFLTMLVTVVVLALLASAVAPYDRTTWLLEVFPAAVLLPVTSYCHERFPLSSLVYLLLAMSGIALIAGGHYSFARVPLGFWLQDWLDLSRNPYDRVGHFLQGAVPALLAREFLLRKGGVTGRHLLPFICVCMAMTLSAVYELVEWAAALSLGQGAEEFLGMQGDEWDTQADMFCALLGALTAMTLLVPLHDRSMAAIGEPCGPRASNHNDTGI
jgi:putative membrane protein